MAADTYSTGDIAFSATLLYIFGEESLYEIEIKDNRAEFCLRVPSLDAGRYRQDFDRGELSISDLRSYMRTFSWLSRTVREMKDNRQHLWTSNN